MNKQQVERDDWRGQRVRIATAISGDTIGTILDVSRDSTGAVEKYAVEWPHYGQRWHFPGELALCAGPATAPAHPLAASVAGSRPNAPYTIRDQVGPFVGTSIVSTDGWLLAVPPDQDYFDGALEVADIVAYLREMAATPELIAACRAVLNPEETDAARASAARRALAKAWGCRVEEVDERV